MRIMFKIKFHKEINKNGLKKKKEKKTACASFIMHLMVEHVGEGKIYTIFYKQTREINKASKIFLI